MKRTAMIALLVALPARALADGAEDTYFGDKALAPDSDEATVLHALSTNRPRGFAPTRAVISKNGEARFVYGGTLPILICAPLYLCDIELQAGEQIRNLQVGDPIRWHVKVAATGAPPSEVKHVVVRPDDVGIKTSLLVTTDRRTYRMRLSADRTQYMTKVSFAYPGDLLAAFGSERAAELKGPAPAPPSAQMPIQTGSLDALSFAYQLEGDSPPWKPVRVYNDGLQTVIELPFAMRQTEAPTLLVVRSEGGLLSDDEVVQVNYRVDGTRYLVDTVFDVADLTAGVGTTQQRVRIRRTR